MTTRPRTMTARFRSRLRLSQCDEHTTPRTPRAGDSDVGEICALGGHPRDAAGSPLSECSPRPSTAALRCHRPRPGSRAGFHLRIFRRGRRASCSCGDLATAPSVTPSLAASTGTDDRLGRTPGRDVAGATSSRAHARDGSRRGTALVPGRRHMHPLAQTPGLPAHLALGRILGTNTRGEAQGALGSPPHRTATKPLALTRP